MQGETGGCEFGRCGGSGEVLPPCFAFLPATYLEVLEACVSLPEPEVRIPDKSHDSSNQADAKEYSCPGTGVARTLEARKNVSELWVGAGHLPAPEHMQCPFEIRPSPELLLCLSFLVHVP